MFLKLIKSIFLHFLIFLLAFTFFKCSSNNQFTEDGEIQKDITNSVNNYNSENWEIRLKSIKNISKYSQTVYAKNSLLLLIKALEDTHSEVRIESLKILKKMKAPAAEEKIGNIAVSDENSNVRFHAFSALQEYGSLKNEVLFLKGIDDKDWLVKEAALCGLMSINDTEIQIRHLDIVLQAIRDTNVSVKLAAISYINIKDPLIYEELTKIINNKESGLSILKAALEKVKGYKLDKTTKKRIIELLTHRDRKVRLLSLQVLKQEELNLNQ